MSRRVIAPSVYLDSLREEPIKRQIFVEEHQALAFEILGIMPRSLIS